MKYQILNLFFGLFLSTTFLSCGKIENSSSQDKYLYTPPQTGSVQFSAALTAITNKCSTCHGAWTGYSESDYIQSGLVTAQNLESSKIYYRNQNATSGPGPRNMPSGGLPAFSAAELQSIVDWIAVITP